MQVSESESMLNCVKVKLKALGTGWCKVYHAFWCKYLKVSEIVLKLNLKCQVLCGAKFTMGVRDCRPKEKER